ncbi:MAG: type II toxin-antitoxin system Phd/YefM family antitoxin [bacterium]|nr:type II toxin-antitoxin system Phd/YefM family antitoxin [bacterium]
MITITFTAKEAKNNFGRLLDEARHSPVGVERNGRRVAVVMSVERYAASEAQHKGRHTLDDIERSYQTLLWRQKEMEADADIRAGRVSNAIRTKLELKSYLSGLRRS